MREPSSSHILNLMVQYSRQLDAGFAALADATRRPSTVARPLRRATPRRKLASSTARTSVSPTQAGALSLTCSIAAKYPTTPAAESTRSSRSAAEVCASASTTSRLGIAIRLGCHAAANHSPPVTRFSPSTRLPGATTSILSTLERRPDVRVSIAAHRDTVRALIPRLLEAQTAKDAARWDALIGKTAAQWDAMQATYIRTARTADGRARIERFITMILGQHGE